MTKPYSLIGKLLAFSTLGLVMSFGARANLLDNASFEDNLLGWNSTNAASVGCGVVPNCWWVRTGTRSLDLTPGISQSNSSVTQGISLTPGTYEFGAYTRISTNEPQNNFDQFQISIFGSGIDEAIGLDPNGVIGHFGADGVNNTTDWMRLSGVFTVGGGSSLLNISFQNFSDPYTDVIVDDAFVYLIDGTNGNDDGQSVSAPGSLMLVAFGLIGMGLVRLRKFQMT